MASPALAEEPAPPPIRRGRPSIGRDFTFALPGELRAWLEEKATADHTSVAQILRTLVLDAHRASQRQGAVAGGARQR